MSVCAAAIRKMVALGLDAGAIADLCEIIEDGQKSVPSTLEKRRAYDRERKRKSAVSTGIPPENAEGTDPVIPPEFHRNSTGNAEIPRARVRDNNPRLVDSLDNNTTQEYASAWPDAFPPSRADLDRLRDALFAAAGDAVDQTAPKIHVLSPILSLAKHGQGPPCDFEADVLAVIAGRSARARPGSIRSWEFFVQPILEARDRRLTQTPQIVEFKPNDRVPQDRRPTPRDDRNSRIYAGAMAALREGGDAC